MAANHNAKGVAVKVSLTGIIVNTLLTVFKFVAGIASASGAMVSDAVHSASDVFGGLIVIIGVRLAAKEPDHEHPYGHERFECVASLILSVALFLTGGAIGFGALQKIMAGTYLTFEIKGRLAAAAAIISILVKEAMFWYTRSNAKKVDSSALAAEAWHHRSDALSSVGALIGICGAKFGFPILEPIASIVICLLILKVAFDIFKDAIDRMVDHACDQELEDRLRQCALRIPGVLSVDLLRTRVFGSKIYVDIEISADSALSLSAAHAISDAVHGTIEREFPQVKHIMVHVNPKALSAGGNTVRY
ncbi:MAG: cation transporter [Oscillibacter sp.]|nr:cation transporter [Oscillibacter sp.]